MTRSKSKGPFLIAILDGFGLNPCEEGNAVLQAATPVIDRLRSNYPSTTLKTHGLRVGLPEGQMGNSEVGHLNIGAGRVVLQDLTRISQSIERGKIPDIPDMKDLLESVKQGSGSALHLIGLLSTGGVHSSMSHVEAIIEAAMQAGVERVFVHAITDGRDRPPKAALDEVGRLVDFLESKRSSSSANQELVVASVLGRYFAMDRDKRWERTKRAYDLFTLGKGDTFSDARTAISSRHDSGQTDEFLEPCLIRSPGLNREPFILSGDSILFFNFRADRMRQLVPAFISNQGSFAHFNLVPGLNISAVATLTEYDPEYPVGVLFKPPLIHNHFGELVSEHGLTQLRIAETEKYPHVTYFFNGGVEKICRNEERILVPSPRDVPTYDLKPEMSACEVTDKLIARIDKGNLDVVILNFANCDMVGHTGSFPAAIKAVETVDTCLGRVLECLERHSGTGFITADHGNADQMIDYETGGPHTFHTTHPVPFVVFSPENNVTLKENGALCDIAPTACQLLGVPQPPEMSGNSLIANA